MWASSGCEQRLRCRKNQGWDAFAYIDACPLKEVQEIHLAGHLEEADELGTPLLIDTHDRPVSARVWELFEHTLEKTGAHPTLIEWDTKVPEWPDLEAEIKRAETRMSLVATGARSYAAQ